MSEVSQTAPKRFPWPLLFISLAFNLLIFGAVGGAYFAGVRIERTTSGAAPAPPISV